MKTKLAILCCMLACTLAQGIEEPDWQKRFEELKQAELATLTAPEVGSKTTIVRRVGGRLFGKITAIGTNTIAVNGQSFRTSQLTPETCNAIFPDMCAGNIALKQIRAEKKQYQVRKAAEEERLKEAEQKRIEAEEEARAQKKEEQRRMNEANERRAAEAAQRLRAQQQTSNVVGDKTLILCLLLVGLFFYFLPSIIAGNRGHHNTIAIIALNLLLGWTLIGWVVALVWALTQVNRPEE